MSTNDELLSTFIEVAVDDDQFLKLVETLTRIGIAGRGKKLYQTCHILHKRGKYYIVHFKELFALDGRGNSMTDEDYSRRNAIAKSLESWGMCDILNPEIMDDSLPFAAFKSIRYSEKAEWDLQQKYKMRYQKNDKKRLEATG